MKKLLLIAFLGACNEIKTDLSQPESVPEAQIGCVLPSNIMFEEREITDLNGNRIIIFYNLTSTVEGAIESAQSLGDGATAYHTGFSSLACMIDGEGPYNCSGPAFVLDFGSHELNSEFINRCLQPSL
jgi:hypothetical protein